MRTITVCKTVIAVLATAALAHAQSGLPCGTSYYNELLRQQHLTEVQAAESQLKMETDQRIQNGEGRSSTHYVIPIVFHIIHDYGSENISDAQVLDQVAILNRDYAKLNADTANIIPEFQGIASSVDIEFRLASIDPDGNCTDGIDRIASKRTYTADDASKLNPWPRAKYLNVWVVKSIGANGVAGYAYYPSAVTGLGLAIDGVIILNDYIGSIGTSQVSHSRALTHEIGHYLNLAHCWGSTNNPGVSCGDDGIPDTPVTKGWDHCPSSASAAKICDTAIVENYQNYMEYSYCSVMFTQDQAFAMHAALNSDVSDRNKLWRPDNLVATGTDITNPPLCGPKADFHANRRMVCEGGTITFTDDSWNGAVASRLWEFDAGTPATSTSASPVVTYNTAGAHSVKLTVTNASGSDSIFRYSYVTVGAQDGIPGPISESFENGDPLQHGWTAINYSNDNISWHSCNYAGASGTSCMMIDNYYNDRNEVDELISPQYDLRWMQNMQLEFKLGFASKVADTGLVKERLRVMVSTNCGQTWSTLLIRSGAQLVSAGQNSNPFSPGYDQDQWRLFTANINSNNAQARVIFKFELTGGTYGNHIYLDDINITGGIVGMQDPAANSSSFTVTPNPAQDQANVHLFYTEKQHVTVSLTDINGRELMEIANEDMGPGEHNLPFSTEGLAAGLYFIRVNDGTSQQVKKIAIQH